MKDAQTEERIITIASEEALTKMLLKDEKKKEKEWCECQQKLGNLKINNNQLLIKINNQKQETFLLKNSLEKV